MQTFGLWWYHPFIPIRYPGELLLIDRLRLAHHLLPFQPRLLREMGTVWVWGITGGTISLWIEIRTFTVHTCSHGRVNAWIGEKMCGNWRAKSAQICAKGAQICAKRAQIQNELHSHILSHVCTLVCEQNAFAEFAKFALSQDFGTVAIGWGLPISLVTV